MKIETMKEELKKCKLFDIDESISSIFEEENLIVSYELKEEDGDALIIVDGIRIIIPELNLSVRCGVYCVYEEEDKDYIPDFSITLIYEKDETDPSKYVYWEQDPILTAIHNYLNGKISVKKSLEDIECMVEIENDKAS